MAGPHRGAETTQTPLGGAVSDYAGQFLLAHGESIRSESWLICGIGSWTLSHHASLSLTTVLAHDGSLLGYFLGTAIGAPGVLGDRYIAPNIPSVSRLDESTIDGVVERVVFDFGGRWIFLLAYDGLSRIYLDPCGSLALVFDIEAPRVASTTTLLGSTAGHGREWLNVGETAFPLEDQFFPLGLTGDPKLDRLMPNHYLDLKTMRATRHWPSGPMAPRPSGDVPDLVATVTETTTRMVEALAAQNPLLISLTAGRDSRMVLACSRQVARRVTCFTFDEPRDGGRQDVEVAGELCRIHELPHQVVPIEPVSSDTELEYLRRIGFAGHSGKARDFLQAARRHLDPDRTWLIAFAGEVARGYYWSRRDWRGKKPDAANLLQRMNLPTTRPFTARMERWLRELEGWENYSLLDLMYLELRVGTWAAPHLYGCASFHNLVVPLCHRRTVRAMLELPIGYRRKQTLAEDVVRSTWPDLMNVPFPRLPGFPDSIRAHLAAVTNRLGRGKR